MRGLIFAVITATMLFGFDDVSACNNPCSKSEPPWWRFVIYPIVAAAAVYLWNFWRTPPPGVVFDPDDPEKIAAEKEARRTLPRFWQTFENPADDECDFAVKFNLTPQKDAEFIWAYDLRRENDRIYGKLGNEPIEPGYEPDTYYEIQPDLIVDWTYFKGNEAKGHFITKVMFSKMPKRFVKRAIKEFGWQTI